MKKLTLTLLFALSLLIAAPACANEADISEADIKEVEYVITEYLKLWEQWDIDAAVEFLAASHRKVIEGTYGPYYTENSIVIRRILMLQNSEYKIEYIRSIHSDYSGDTIRIQIKAFGPDLSKIIKMADDTLDESSPGFLRMREDAIINILQSGDFPKGPWSILFDLVKEEGRWKLMTWY